MKIQRKTHAQNELRSCFIWAVRFCCVVFFISFSIPNTRIKIIWNFSKCFRLFVALLFRLFHFFSHNIISATFFFFFQGNESLFVSLYAKMLSSNENENAQIDFEQ